MVPAADAAAPVVQMKPTEGLFDPKANAAPAAAPVAAAPAGESMFDKIKHAVDQDGDGNPLNDIMNKLGGH